MNSDDKVFVILMGMVCFTFGVLPILFAVFCILMGY